MRTWSFSSMNKFETCPRQYNLTYNAKVIPFQDTVHTIWGKEVHSALEGYVKQRVEAPDELLPVINELAPIDDKYLPYVRWANRVIDMPGEKLIEWEFALTKSLTPTTFADQTAWCRGVIDVAVINGNKAIAIDWKTGKVRPDSDQLKMFAAVVMQQYPRVQSVKTVYVWLAHDQTTVETYHRDEHLAGIWRHFMAKAQRLEQAYEKDKWIPKPSGLCAGWCGAGAAHCEFWSPKR